jgi:uncharacterized protein
LIYLGLSDRQPFNMRDWPLSQIEILVTSLEKVCGTWNQSTHPMKCPNCKKPVKVKENNPFLPFCSERCKLVDLGKWLDEKYVIPDNNSPSLPDPSSQDED